MRVNFSKSGVGASIGVKGARITASSRGSTYITVGSHGFYYRQSVGGRSSSTPTAQPASPPFPAQSPAGPGTIPTACVSDLVESSDADLVKQLNERARAFNPATLAWVACVLPIIAAGATDQMWWSALVGLPLALGFVLQQFYKNRTTTRLIYELSDAESAKIALVQQAVVHLSQAHRIWRITQQVATDRQKYNAGASTLIKRTVARAGTMEIPKVKTTLSVVGIDVGGIKLFFLPDMILYWQDNTFANISYDTFNVAHGTTRFVEDEAVPGDALIVDRTWKYVNKSGGPDRRFNDNRQLPIAQYGVLELHSSTGLNIKLNTSSADKATAFANCLAERFTRPRSSGPAAPPPSIPPGNNGPRAHALKVLGLSGSPSAGEISTAYHHSAQMYHPDRVTGWGQSFRS